MVLHPVRPLASRARSLPGLLPYSNNLCLAKNIADSAFCVSSWSKADRAASNFLNTDIEEVVLKTLSRVIICCSSSSCFASELFLFAAV